MTHQMRVDWPGAFHHVMARGDNREPLFEAEHDRNVYLHLLRSLLVPLRIEVHAYCLMTNHVHLLLRSGGRLADFMERLHGRYAAWFNRKYGRVGHIFQRRYMAKAVSREPYLFEVGRYIHMNPVRAGIVLRPEMYPWSSMSSYANSELGWINKDVLMAGFADECKAFYEYTTTQVPIEEDGFGWPIDYGWYEPPAEGASVSVSPPQRCAEPEAGMILTAVCSHFGVALNGVKRGWKNPHRYGTERLASLWLLRNLTSLTLARIAEELGYRSVQGVSNRLKFADERIRTDPEFKSLLDDLAAKLAS